MRSAEELGRVEDLAVLLVGSAVQEQLLEPPEV
jgi:hypothetical protein